MDLLLRFQGGFGVESGPNSYCQDTIITVPQDVAEKSGLFVADFVVNVKVPLGSMNRFLHVTCDETGNPLGNWYFDAASALAEWANANYPLNWELAVTNCQLNYPLNWELGVASDLTDVELAEADHLDELYDARLDELYDAYLADLFEEDQLVENQLAEANEWAEEARIAGCSTEGAPYSWNYDMQ